MQCTHSAQSEHPLTQWLASSCSPCLEELASTGCTPALSHPLILGSNFSLCPQHWGLPLSSTLFYLTSSPRNYDPMEYFLLFFFFDTRSHSLQADFLASNSQELVLQVHTPWLFWSVSLAWGIESRASYIPGRHSVTVFTIFTALYTF